MCSLQGKKVCGILTEMNAEVTRVRYVVVGIGINVNQPNFPKELENEAISLRMVNGQRMVARGTGRGFVKIARPGISSAARRNGRAPSILQRFAEQSSWVRGKQVRIEENGSRVEGTTEGLDDRGFLQVRTAHATECVQKRMF